MVTQFAKVIVYSASFMYISAQSGRDLLPLLLTLAHNRFGKIILQWNKRSATPFCCALDYLGFLELLTLLLFWLYAYQAGPISPKQSHSACWFSAVCGFLSYPPIWAPKAKPWWFWKPFPSWFPGLVYWVGYFFQSVKWSYWDQIGIQGRNYLNIFLPEGKRN